MSDNRQSVPYIERDPVTKKTRARESVTLSKESEPKDMDDDRQSEMFCIEREPVAKKTGKRKPLVGTESLALSLDEQKVKFEHQIKKNQFKVREEKNQNIAIKNKKRGRTYSRDANIWGRDVPMATAKSIFDYYDKHNRGKLSRGQWYTFLQKYGMENWSRELGALVGANSHGEVSWPVFKKWICRTNYFVDGDCPAETKCGVLVALIEKFASYDKGDKGFLTIDDFTALQKDWNYPLKKEDFFRVVDTDNNKKITFNEYYYFFFHPYMKKRYPGFFEDTKRFPHSREATPECSGRETNSEWFPESKMVE